MRRSLALGVQNADNTIEWIEIYERDKDLDGVLLVRGGSGESAYRGLVKGGDINSLCSPEYWPGGCMFATSLDPACADQYAKRTFHGTPVEWLRHLRGLWHNQAYLWHHKDQYLHAFDLDWETTAGPDSEDDDLAEFTVEGGEFTGLHVGRRIPGRSGAQDSGKSAKLEKANQELKEELRSLQAWKEEVTRKLSAFNELLKEGL